MAEETVLKNVYQDGPVVASIVKSEEAAKVFVKGAEPQGADDLFGEALKKVIASCREHLGGVGKIEINSVLTSGVAAADAIDFPKEKMEEIGAARINLMDGDSGLTVRVMEAELQPTPLSYANLLAGGDFSEQPGIVRVPDNLPRKPFRDLSAEQQQVYRAAAAMSGPAILKLVCVEDGGLRIIATVRDLSLAKARSVMAPLGTLAQEVSGGASLDSVAEKMSIFRA